MYETIKYEIKENIAYLTISRPQALNALNTKVLEELTDAIKVADKDDNVRCVILTGEGRAFAAGADISEMQNLQSAEGRKLAMLGHNLMHTIENTEKIVIAAVNGFALGGGCELSMSCDIRIASSKAKFGQPEVALGITPGFGGTQRLSKFVGKGMAKYLILTGDPISSDEALRIGLVEKVVEPDDLMPTCEELAKKISSKAPIAVGMSKTLINKGYHLDLFSGCALEAEGFGSCFGTLDQKEGMKAFLEKRPATFQNK